MNVVGKFIGENDVEGNGLKYLCFLIQMVERTGND